MVWDNSTTSKGTRSRKAKWTLTIPNHRECSTCSDRNVFQPRHSRSTTRTHHENEDKKGPMSQSDPTSPNLATPAMLSFYSEESSGSSSGSYYGII